MGSGPTRHVRRRLKKKTPVPGRRTGSTKDAPSARDRAIQSGLIPKARNAYALFTRDEMKKRHACRRVMACCFEKDISSMEGAKCGEQKQVSGRSRIRKTTTAPSHGGTRSAQRTTSKTLTWHLVA